MSRNKIQIKTTSNIEKYVPNLVSLQRKFNNNVKFTITEYANNARYEINKNAKIQEHISRLKYINTLFKKLLTDTIHIKGGKKEIYKLLIANNNIFKEDNKTLKKETKEELKKLNKYQNILYKEIKPLKEEIKQLNDLNFILKNNLIYQQNRIIREEYLLLMAENNLDKNRKIEVILNGDLNVFDEFLLEISKVYQLQLIKQLKQLNKIKTKNEKKLQKIKNLRKLRNENRIENNNNINIEINDKKDDKKIEEEFNEINKTNNENSSIYFHDFELLNSFTTIENLEEKIKDKDIKINPNLYYLPQKNLVKTHINLLTYRGNNYNNKSTNNIKIRRATSFEKLNNSNNQTFNGDNKNKEYELPKLNFKQINFNKDNKNYNFTSNIGRKVFTPDKSNKNDFGQKTRLMNNEKKRIIKDIKLLKKKIKKNEIIIQKFKEYYDIIINKYDELIYQPEIESYVLSMQDIFQDEE